MGEPLVRTEPGVVWRVTLNRPNARNAISPAMRVALMKALGEAAADPACRVVVLRGEGSDFSAGAPPEAPRTRATLRSAMMATARRSTTSGR